MTKKQMITGTKIIDTQYGDMWFVLECQYAGETFNVWLIENISGQTRKVNDAIEGPNHINQFVIA
jgi:hypothetical protein